MTEQNLQNNIQQYATRLGDDSIVLGHRVSEWCSYAPFLEEDLALANTALDYIGRARLFYHYAAELADDGRDEDDFAFMRDQREFQNLLIYEMPRGDFAYSMVRQLLVDVFNGLFLEKLMESADQTLSAIAAKAIKETRYHLRRSRDWVLRLGDGTAESHQITRAAVEDLWGYTHELFAPDAAELRLIEQGIAVDTRELKSAWLAQVSDILQQATLSVPEAEWSVKGGREGYHTENLGHLLNEMQSVHRAYPGQKW
jgi:ring-1,2-phenylacetyl-CoA epoxidase subunit PaaC